MSANPADSECFGDILSCGYSSIVSNLWELRDLAASSSWADSQPAV